MTREDLNDYLTLHNDPGTWTNSTTYRNAYREMWKELKARATADRELLIQTASAIAAGRDINSSGTEREMIVSRIVAMARAIITEVDRPAIEAADKEISKE